MLREDIEKVIKKFADPKQAAKAVCELLENEIGLMGNGWFDDDPEMLEVLSA